MGSDIDPFADILPDPAVTNARAGGKFQPKAKARPRKETAASVPSTLPDGIKDKLVTPASNGPEATQSLQPVDVANNRLKDSAISSFPTSDVVGTKEPLKGNDGSFSEDVGYMDAVHSETAISDGNGDWHSNFGKSLGEADTLGFDLDPFDDILPEPVTGNSRPGGKFLPKAKPRPRKEPSVPITSVFPNAMKEQPIKQAFAGSGATQSVQPVDVADNKLNDPDGPSLTTLEIVGTKEPSKDNAYLFSDNRCLESLNPSSQLVVSGKDVVSRNALNEEVEVSGSTGYWHSSFGKSAGENADIFSGLDCLDDFLTQSTSGTVSAVSKSLRKVDMDAQTGNKSSTSYSVDRAGEGSLSPSEVPNLNALKDSELNSGCDAAEALPYPDYCMTQDPVTCGETAVSNNDFQIGNRRLETEEGGPFPDLETPDIMSEATIASGRRTSKFLPKSKVQTEKEKSSVPHPVAVESAMCLPEAQLAASETEYINEGSIPAFPPDEVLNYASVGFGDSIPPDPTSELRVTEETRNVAETSPSNATISGGVHSEAVAGMSGEEGAKTRKGKTSTVSDLSQKAKKSSAALEENEGGKSSRQLRKRVGTRQLVDESEDEANDPGGIPAEAPSTSGLDEYENDDDEYTVESSSRKKRALRKSKKPVPENEKPTRKRKKASDAPDKSAKEPPKKFSHSTRRTKRCVNKAWLNTPEDEIDYRRLPIKDLILFADFKERLAVKEAKTSKTPLTNRSADNSFPGEASHSEEENFASEQGRDFTDDQASAEDQLTCPYFNYQSYMDKTPIARWSKQDTELFYEGVRQFGTDFSMIQQLFPGRTRHQIKLKFKKEERQHPLRLSEAVKNRAQDHSHFELVIERLKQAAAQAEQDNGEDSIDMTGEEVEEVTQIDEEATQPKQERGKSEQDEEVAGEDLERKAEEDLEADVPGVASHLKSDESEDELDLWSQYKSEY